jgi:hypothetical protein
MVANSGDPEVTSIKFHAIKVKVMPSGTIPQTGEVACNLTVLGNTGGGKVTGNNIELDHAKGPFALQFDLDRSLDWATSGDLIWLLEGSCPMDVCPVPNQIWIDNTPRNRVLTIMDMNTGPKCELHYRLNFTDGRYCDPVIENGGGNIFA